MYAYIHIPFCDQKCSYCRFASVGTLQALQIETYVQSLILEIETSELLNIKQASLRLGEGNTTPPSLGLSEEGNTTPPSLPLSGEGHNIGGLKTLYFGGGTPGVLKIGQLQRIILAIEKKYGFDENIEINIETTPFNVTKENVEAWSKLGINRVSMGVQTLNNDALQEIQRGNKGNIMSALDNLAPSRLILTTPPSGKQSLSKTPPSLPLSGEGQDSGIENISIDFILGLPHVEKGEILEDIKSILKKYNYITHISVYMLEEYYQPDTIIESKYDTITYPDNWKNMGLKDEDFSGEYSEIKDFLEAKGFNRYEISNYAKPGFECKHNISYWNHGEVIAFGLGAYGYVDNIRYRNSDNFSDYYARKNIINEKNDSEDIFLEKIMFSLRTSGITPDLEEKLDEKIITYFLNEKYLIRKNNTLCLSDTGVSVMDYILGEIV